MYYARARARLCICTYIQIYSINFTLYNFLFKCVKKKKRRKKENIGLKANDCAT